MITDALMSFALTIVNFLVGIFPSSEGLPEEVTTAVETIGGYVGILDPIVPISTLATVLGLLITFELAVFAFKGVRWAVSFLPFGVGGKG
jgi:hypothetical protein